MGQVLFAGSDVDVNTTPEDGLPVVGEVLVEAGFGVDGEPLGVIEIRLGVGGVVAGLYYAGGTDFERFAQGGCVDALGGCVGEGREET